MKLKDLKNDGVWEKRVKKTILSEVELVVDEEKIYDLIFILQREYILSMKKCNVDAKRIKVIDACLSDFRSTKNISKALVSSMSEWLRLNKNNKGE